LAKSHAATRGGASKRVQAPTVPVEKKLGCGVEQLVHGGAGGLDELCDGFVVESRNDLFRV